MIIWIASYPKSGNTWVRSLIASYLFSESGNFDFSLLEKIPRFPNAKQFSPLIDLNDLMKDPIKITFNIIGAAAAAANLLYELSMAAKKDAKQTKNKKGKVILLKSTARLNFSGSL